MLMEVWKSPYELMVLNEEDLAVQSEDKTETDRQSKPQPVSQNVKTSWWQRLLQRLMPGSH